MSLEARIKTKFDYDVADLTAYTDENSDELHIRCVSGGETLALIRTLEGIKGKQKMKIFDDTLTLQDAGCDMTVDTNGSKFSDREIEVVDMGWKKKFCNNDLVGFWTQLELKPGIANENEDMPFEQAITEFFMELQAELLENIIWQGDTASLDPNLDKFDGFIKLLTVLNGSIDLNTGGTGAITDANALSILQSIWRATPKELRKKNDLIFPVGQEIFDNLMANMTDLNLFHYNPEMLSDGLDSIKVPGTKMTVSHVSGLDGSGNVYMGRASNLTFGTDLESDFEEFRLWYSMDDDVIYARAKFRGGVQVALIGETGVYVPV